MNKRTVIFETERDDGPHEVGRATLQPDGTVALAGFDANPDQKKRIAKGISPNDRDLFTPADGLDFLEALPRTFRGSRFWARFANAEE